MGEEKTPHEFTCFGAVVASHCYVEHNIRRNNGKLRRCRVGGFLLSQLRDLNINVGLYRDDGLAITNATPRDTENIKKAICRIFNNNGLRVTIEAIKQIMNFLDVTFNLNGSTYQPFTKPNTSLQYVHRNNATTSSGTTLPLAKTPAPTSDTNSAP